MAGLNLTSLSDIKSCKRSRLTPPIPSDRVRRKMLNLSFHFGGLNTKAAWLLFRIWIIFSSQFPSVAWFLWISSFGYGAQSSPPVNVERGEVWYQSNEDTHTTWRWRDVDTTRDVSVSNWTAEITLPGDHLRQCGVYGTVHDSSWSQHFHRSSPYHRR